MTSKDLRIGNFVRDAEGNIGQVYAIFQSGIHFKPFDSDIIQNLAFGEIQPIKITRETLKALWGKQCGIVSDSHYRVGAKTFIFDYDFGYDQLLVSKMCDIDGRGSILTFRFLKVHELQNIMLALTGVECHSLKPTV